MARPQLRLICAATALLAAATTGTAEAKVPSASDLLDRVADADRAPYRARQLVVYFGSGAEESAAVLDVRSSKEGRFVRAESGGRVTRLWSEDEMGVVEGHHVTKYQADVTQVRVRPADVRRKYALGVAEPAEILGIPVVPLTLTRRKDDRLAERWWIHADTGVVYRRELFDRSGDLVGMATLLDMSWGKPGPSEPAPADAQRAPAAKQVDAADAPKHLAGSYELWRTLALEIDDRPCEQWVYSDGLHALSVFRMDGNLKLPDTFEAADVDGERLWTGPGPGTWAWEGDGRSYVIVAEETGLDVGALLEPFPKGGPTIWARLGSVWSRLFRGIAGLFD